MIKNDFFAFLIKLITYFCSAAVLFKKPTPSQINLIKKAKNQSLLVKKFKNTESAQLWRKALSEEVVGETDPTNYWAPFPALSANLLARLESARELHAAAIQKTQRYHQGIVEFYETQPVCRSLAEFKLARKLPERHPWQIALSKIFFYSGQDTKKTNGES